MPTTKASDRPSARVASTSGESATYCERSTSMIGGEIAFSCGPLTIAYGACRKRIFHRIVGGPNSNVVTATPWVSSARSQLLRHRYASIMRERAGTGETVKTRCGGRAITPKAPAHPRDPGQAIGHMRGSASTIGESATYFERSPSVVAGELAFSCGPLTLAYCSRRARVPDGTSLRRRAPVFSTPRSTQLRTRLYVQSMRERAGAGGTVKTR